MIAPTRHLVGFRRVLSPTPLICALVALIGSAHAVALNLPPDEASPIGVATHLYAVLLVGALIWLACAVGRGVLRLCGVQGESRLEHDLFAVATGFGLLALLVACLGLAQVLTRPVLILAVCGAAAVARRDIADLARSFTADVRAALNLRRSVRSHGPAFAVLVPLVEVLFAALLVRALAPPFENDVLTYHLQGPRLFLERGALVPLPDIQQANMPLAVNMLYLLGLAFWSDEVGSVLHLALAAMGAAATFAFGRRFFGELVGWLAATTFLSTQLVLAFATIAFVDFGLALFDFLGVYAFIVWRHTGRRGWLVVSGLMIGSALASKYLGAITAVSLGVWLLAVTCADWKRLGLGGALRLLIAFGLPAAAVAAPWYAKNLLWFGNPVWPFLSGNALDFNMYLGGTTRFAGIDGLFGPFKLLAYLYAYGSLEMPLVRPPLQLLVIPLLLVLPKHRVVTALLLIATVHVLVFSEGAHLFRYMLQALPALSLVAAYVLGHLIDATHRRAIVRASAMALVLAGVAAPTATSIAVAVGEGHFAQLVGVESRQTYLERKLDNYPLVEYLNEGREPVSRVLMIGDNRTYYLRVPAYVDVSMELFQRIALAPDALTAQGVLAEHDISHVMMNSRDLTFFVPIDPEHRILTWLSGFREGHSGYLEPVATSKDSTLYRVIR